MMNYEQDLADLRAAAEAREADRAQFLLKRLFQQMEFVLALGIAAEQVYQHVETFERYHPGEVWARRMLVQVVMTATAPDRSVIEQAFQHFNTPGSANFIKGLYDLYQGTEKTNSSAARVGFLVSAAVNAMTARLVERYFGERPETWGAYRAQSVDFQQVALDFWTNDDVSALDTQMWLAIADEVEDKINRRLFPTSNHHGEENPNNEGLGI